MARGKYNVYAAQCPTRQALDRIADKWTALIVGLLAERTHRFGELRRKHSGAFHTRCLCRRCEVSSATVSCTDSR